MFYQLFYATFYRTVMRFYDGEHLIKTKLTELVSTFKWTEYEIIRN